ncbi:hypothetical protein LZ31DRAFT_317247 [Colletotrichum somersetense]|nr:hypothetical protein LZ31DRAFT_317247 [Colletotrichum somersetense]
MSRLQTLCFSSLGCMLLAQCSMLDAPPPSSILALLSFPYHSVSLPLSSLFFWHDPLRGLALLHVSAHMEAHACMQTPMAAPELVQTPASYYVLGTATYLYLGIHIRTMPRSTYCSVLSG